MSIEKGTIIVDENKLLYPGDILHQAGLIAVVPFNERWALNAATIGKREQHAAEEMKLSPGQRCDASKIPLRSFVKKDFDSSLEEWLKTVNPDAVFVKTFPYPIPSRCINIPPKGFINFYYAPLPRWRGSYPVFWMIRNIEKMGGITVHQMYESFDAGPILLEQVGPFGPDVNFGMFYTQLAYAGIQITMQLLQSLHNGTLLPRQQHTEDAQ